MNDLSFESEYVDYILIQIETVSGITTPYNVTFLSLLDVFDDSYNSFSFNTSSISISNDYTYDVFHNQIDVAHLLRGQYHLMV